MDVLEGGLLGRLIVGLSHEEKKSSSLVAESEALSGVTSGMSVMTTSLGNLRARQQCARTGMCQDHTFGCRLRRAW